MDKLTGKPRGFGFVVFEHVSCVEVPWILQENDRVFNLEGSVGKHTHASLKSEGNMGYDGG